MEKRRRPKAYNGGICGKEKKVKEELAHPYYCQKPVVFRLNTIVCSENRADKKHAATKDTCPQQLLRKKTDVK